MGVMTTISATTVLEDAFGRVHEALPAALEDLSFDLLTWRPDHDANSIGWLAWHLARVQDDHLAGVGDIEQVWTAKGFADRFALPYAVSSIGYGHTSAEVGAFADLGTAEPLAALLLDYDDAVHRQTLAILHAMDEAAYERIVDRSWDPPVTAAVRLVSVVGDITAHLGQIEYVKGLAVRRVVGRRPIA